MRRLIIYIAFSLLVASSHGRLLAQKGQGKMGGAGVDATPPAATRGSNHTSTHTAGASQLSVGDRISNNTGLSTRIQPLIPTGMTLQAASAGFKNQGQFIAALHVSHNLNIPFDQLKAKLTRPGELRFQLIKRDVQIVRYVQCRDELPLVLESGRGCLQRQDRKSVV